MCQRNFGGTFAGHDAGQWGVEAGQWGGLKQPSVGPKVENKMVRA